MPTTTTSKNNLRVSSYFHDRKNTGEETFNDIASYNLKVGNTRTVGDNIPNWRQRIANGDDATTSLTGTRFRAPICPYAIFAQEIVGFEARYVVPAVYSVYQAAVVTGHAVPTWPLHYDQTSLVTANNLAKKRFVNNLINTQTAFQGGVFFGELAETVRLLKHPIEFLKQDLHKYLGTLKKRSRNFWRLPPKKRLKTAKDTLTGTWLEYTLGWKPFIYDINNAAEAASRLLSQRPQRRRVRATGSDEWRQSTTGTWVASGSINVQYTDLESESRTVKYYGSVNLEVEPTPWRMAGFSPDQFLPTVWELIPYSFVVDYFSNIGDIIYAASAPRSNVRWTAKTEITEYKYTRRLFQKTFVTPGVLRRFYSVPGNFEDSCSETRVNRASYGGSLVPSLQFELPGVSTQWANVGALLLLSKKMTPYHL